MKLSKLLAVILSMILISVYFSGCAYSNGSTDEFYRINQLIKDEDFFKAEVIDKTIVLYDKSNSVTKKIPYDEASKKSAPLYIEKIGNTLYFVTEGVVDDRAGIMFVNDDSDSFLDGIAEISRIGGNSYHFNTRD